MCNIRNLMPPYYTGALGEIILLLDDGKSILKDMQKGTLLTGSDESVKYNRATYGYIIFPHSTNGYVNIDMAPVHHNYSRHYVLSIVSPLMSFQYYIC